MGSCDVSVQLLSFRAYDEGGGVGHRGGATLGFLGYWARACRKPNNEVCLRKSTALSGVFFMTMDNLFSVLCVYTWELRVGGIY